MTRWQRVVAWLNHRAKAVWVWVGAGYTEVSSQVLTGQGLIGKPELALIANASIFAYLKSNGKAPPKAKVPPKDMTALPPIAFAERTTAKPVHIPAPAPVTLPGRVSAPKEEP